MFYILCMTRPSVRIVPGAQGGHRGHGFEGSDPKFIYFQFFASVSTHGFH